jgi:hypothetical protein
MLNIEDYLRLRKNDENYLSYLMLLLLFIYFLFFINDVIIFSKKLALFFWHTTLIYFMNKIYGYTGSSIYTHIWHLLNHQT